MRRFAILVGLAALLAGRAAVADTLEYSYGAKVQGTLEEVTFRIGGVPSMYPRELLQSVELREGKDDVAVLSSGAKREGRLITVRFKSAAGILTITRSKLKSITLGDGEAAAPRAEAGAEPRERTDESDDERAVEKDDVTTEDLEQREILGQNRALARAAFDKADEIGEGEVQKLKDKHLKDAEKVVKDADRLEKSIKSKLKRRRDAIERWEYSRRRYGTSSSSRYRRPPDFSSDGLEKDKRDYKNAKKRKSQLKKAIDDAMEKIDKRRRIRKRRVRVAYELHKKHILDGEKLTEDQMKEKYFAALNLELAPEKGTEGDEKASASRDSKKKENPFDEMFKEKKEAGSKRSSRKGAERKVTRGLGDLKGKREKDEFKREFE